MSSAEISYRRRWVNDQEVLPTDWKFNGRPLVVIDPHDSMAVERLQDLYITAERNGLSGLSMGAALNEFANPKPPRPDEPTGLGAVVEDEEGARWVLRHTNRSAAWVPENDAGYRTYADITAVRILSEGVKP